MESVGAVVTTFSTCKSAIASAAGELYAATGRSVVCSKAPSACADVRSFGNIKPEWLLMCTNTLKYYVYIHVYITQLLNGIFIFQEKGFWAFIILMNV